MEGEPLPRAGTGATGIGRVGTGTPRFALIGSLGLLERWHLRCLDYLSGCAVLAGVADVPAASNLDRASSLFGRFGRRARSDVAREVDVRLSDVPRLVFGRGRLSPEPEPLDFVLKLGPGPVPVGLSETARYGLWCFEHENQGEAIPFLREVYKGEDVTAVSLLAIRSQGHQAAVLERGWFRTEKRSYASNAERIQASIAAWPARICRRLIAREDGGLPSAGIDATRPNPTRRPEVQFHRLCARIAGRRLAFAWRRLFRHNQWNVGVLSTPVETILASGAHADDMIQWFPLPGRDGFLADPFGVERGGGLHLLCEYFDYRSGLGRICAIEFAERRFSTRPIDALTLPVHMSYPCLVEDAGETYCVPETYSANEIALYRAVDFPREWSKVAVLVERFPGVDPTVFRHDGRWWLTCTRRGVEEDAELWVWYADNLRGPWAPHAGNPVKVDVRGARPGGTPFVREGALYRPAQDCSRRYGWRIVIQRVTRLTPTEFSEEPAAVLEPSPDSPFPAGRHTLSPVGDLVLIDGHRAVFAWPALLAFLKICGRNLWRLRQ